ncbi:HEPN domain-containing protein [Urechidicola vernalis]|uniref:HEPN domain-containing protein n=1 Tax=Urechidicola vernalis TaxID=3075600 RepID=A0ABU2Y4M9_9FLAO|nr:HEPN domain-containing protein [Urechidicola sp. P050]MDT0553147.1 HEPN domain-containing protein [Urechidicola sp. P050]
MQSFRTEFENPIVERDIIELERKIREFKEGKVDEEKFRSLRLARGVYGQRQLGVQMIRIKLPFGRVTSDQLHRICDVSDEYSRGRLHITTRQDIQIHHVSLDRTPELWAELEKSDVTLREACGNTVRNVTASETAGIDKDEPFDVSPYADALFRFFLRNPICQEMGRKFKISFSGTEADTGLSYMHDLGFIAKIKDGKKGFKVLAGGGLGSQPRHGDVLYDFIESDKIIPLMEGVLRVFDRYGERSRRAKARMKFLIKDIGFDAFVELVNEERLALSNHTVAIDTNEFEQPIDLSHIANPVVKSYEVEAFELWKESNVIQQKQEGLFAIGIKVLLGDFYTDKARLLADLIKNYAGDELRLSLRQNILVKHVKEELLPFFFVELGKLGFAELGYNATQDITACPGTDTCNLGISSSTGIADRLEEVLKTEYPQYTNNKDITIKISGCMNACGQHNMSEIGFQGMTIRTKDKQVAPALQVLLGGGNLGNGNGRFSDKVIKIPSKRGDEALRYLLNDYGKNAEKEERFLNYYDRQGEKYFYELLKPLANIENLIPSDFIDWGNDKKYVKAIGVGECAGVVIDLIQTLIYESEEKIANAEETIVIEKWSDSIYHSYAAIVNAAKALLLSESKKTNTHAGIVRDFDSHFVETGIINLPTNFSTFVYQINQNKPSKDFALKYLEDAKLFVKSIEEFREVELKSVV